MCCGHWNAIQEKDITVVYMILNIVYRVLFGWGFAWGQGKRGAFRTPPLKALPRVHIFWSVVSLAIFTPTDGRVELSRYILHLYGLAHQRQ